MSHPPTGEMVSGGYSARDVARMLDLPVSQVRSYARAGLIRPSRGPRGEYRFSFQDLVLLRTAKRLVDTRVPAARVRRALERIRERLPGHRPLCAVQIMADGDRVLVRDGDALWSADSGQSLLPFDRAVLEPDAAPRAHPGPVREDPEGERQDLDAEEWFGLGSDLEAASPDHAREAYRRALELAPDHVETRVNLGRLLHEAGKVAAAEAHYRLALRIAPGNPIALYNLGVSLEDLGRESDALEAYRAAIENDPGCADAYYNLARLLEKTGDPAAALRYLQTYRNLTEGD